MLAGWRRFRVYNGSLSCVKAGLARESSLTGRLRFMRNERIEAEDFGIVSIN